MTPIRPHPAAAMDLIAAAVAVPWTAEEWPFVTLALAAGGAAVDLRPSAVARLARAGPGANLRRGLRRLVAGGVLTPPDEAGRSRLNPAYWEWALPGGPRRLSAGALAVARRAGGRPAGDPPTRAIDHAAE